MWPSRAIVDEKSEIQGHDVPERQSIQSGTACSIARNAESQGLYVRRPRASGQIDLRLACSGTRRSRRRGTRRAGTRTSWAFRALSARPTTMYPSYPSVKGCDGGDWALSCRECSREAKAPVAFINAARALETFSLTTMKRRRLRSLSLAQINACSWEPAQGRGRAGDFGRRGGRRRLHPIFVGRSVTAFKQQQPERAAQHIFRQGIQDQVPSLAVCGAGGCGARGAAFFVSMAASPQSLARQASRSSFKDMLSRASSSFGPLALKSRRRRMAPRPD